MGRDRESVARNPAIAQSPDNSTNIVTLLDDEGRVQTQLKGPPEADEAYLVAVSPDGSRLAVVWAGPKVWVFTRVRPGYGQTRSDLCPGHRFHLGLGFQPGRHAPRHRRRRWPDTSLGHFHRHDDRPMARAHVARCSASRSARMAGAS